MSELSVRGQPENSLHWERTHAEWFSRSKCLGVLPHIGDLDVFQYHIEESEGWWLFGCCSSVAEHSLHKPGALGLIAGDCWPFINSLFKREARISSKQAHYRIYIHVATKYVCVHNWHCVGSPPHVALECSRHVTSILECTLKRVTRTLYVHNFSCCTCLFCAGLDDSDNESSFSGLL